MLYLDLLKNAKLQKIFFSVFWPKLKEDLIVSNSKKIHSNGYQGDIRSTILIGYK